MHRHICLEECVQEEAFNNFNTTDPMNGIKVEDKCATCVKDGDGFKKMRGPQDGQELWLAA